MAAGSLKNRVVFYEIVRTTNRSGEQISSRSELATVWADIVERDGGEREQNGRVRRAKDLLATIRYNSSIVPGLVLYFNDVYYDVNSVISNDSKYMALECSAYIN